MKTILSSIATAIAMIAASGAVSAQPTVSTSQAGTGNSLYVVQQAPDYEYYELSATIRQTGNGNLAGDPINKTPGIYQIRSYDAYADIAQTGDRKSVV